MAPSIRLEGLTASEEIGPGGSRRIAITVTNISGIVDQYILALTGLDDSWFTLAPRSVSLFPSASARVELTLQPPVGKQAVSGDYPFTLLATSASDPTASASLSSELRITAEGKPGLEIRPLRAEGRKASFRAVLKNPSNVPVSIELAVRDAEDELRTWINPVGAVPVPPGEERAVKVTVRPRRREAVGGPHPYDLEFLGLRPGTEDLLDPGLKRFGQYTYIPPLRTLALPLWLRRLPIWALLALLLLLLALLFLGGRKVGSAVANAAKPTATLTAIPTPTMAKPTVAVPPPIKTVSVSLPVHHVNPPIIRRFTVHVDPHSGALSLVWQTLGAERAQLNGVLVAASGSKIVSREGPRTYILKGLNGAGVATAKLILPNAPPPKVQTISLARPAILIFTLLHPHVGQPYSLAWRTADAKSVTLDGTPVLKSGSFTLHPPLKTKRYVLVARNTYGQVTGSVKVTVK